MWCVMFGAFLWCYSFVWQDILIPSLIRSKVYWPANGYFHQYNDQCYLPEKVQRESRKGNSTHLPLSHISIQSGSHGRRWNELERGVWIYLKPNQGNEWKVMLKGWYSLSIPSGPRAWGKELLCVCVRLWLGMHSGYMTGIPNNIPCLSTW